MSYYYILPTDRDIKHHGVLGMKWGVRRYQPYSVVPRASGEGGKEIGLASRSDRRVAKKNTKTAFAEIKKNKKASDKWEKELNKRDESKPFSTSKEWIKYNEAERKIGKAILALEDSKIVLGSDEFNKVLDKINNSLETKEYIDKKLGFREVFRNWAKEYNIPKAPTFLPPPEKEEHKKRR